jgi:hypothetical protein
MAVSQPKTTTPIPAIPAATTTRPHRRCARCGAIDARADRRASLWALGVAFFTFLALMWHPLLALLLIIAAIAFRMTTRRRICDVCGYDGREDMRRGFQIERPHEEAHE